MKNFKKGIISAMVAFIVVIGVSSCDKDKVIQPEDIPAAATAFLATYFPDATITQAKKDRDGLLGKEYEVYLNNGTKVDFDKNGNWIEVDGSENTPIPTGFILESIVTYVVDNYPNADISAISKERNGFDVELTNGLDLEFDSNGGFLRID